MPDSSAALQWADDALSAAASIFVEAIQAWRYQNGARRAVGINIQMRLPANGEADGSVGVLPHELALDRRVALHPMVMLAGQRFEALGFAAAGARYAYEVDSDDASGPVCRVKGSLNAVDAFLSAQLLAGVLRDMATSIGPRLHENGAEASLEVDLAEELTRVTSGPTSIEGLGNSSSWAPTEAAANGASKRRGPE